MGGSSGLLLVYFLVIFVLYFMVKFVVHSVGYSCGLELFSNDLEDKMCYYVSSCSDDFFLEGCFDSGFFYSEMVKVDFDFNGFEFMISVLNMDCYVFFIVSLVSFDKLLVVRLRLSFVDFGFCNVIPTFLDKDCYDKDYLSLFDTNFELFFWFIFFYENYSFCGNMDAVVDYFSFRSVCYFLYFDSSIFYFSDMLCMNFSSVSFCVRNVSESFDDFNKCLKGVNVGLEVLEDSGDDADGF